MRLDKFHVITTIFNPAAFDTRIALYNAFKQHMSDSGVRLWTVEVAQGATPFAVTEAGDPYALQLRTSEILWHKERSLNLLAQRLPHDWEYLCWVDADIEFPNWRKGKSWVEDTWSALQIYKIVQLFHTCLDLGPNYEVLDKHTGFGYSYQMGAPFTPGYGTFWHPGYAWGCTREAWDGMGGLVDFAVLGAGDHHMATAWIGKVDVSIHGKMSGPYFDKLRQYQAVCEKAIRQDIGFVSNTILHYWHGKKKDRRYQDRWKILTGNAFDPSADIKNDYQGLYQLVDHHDQRSINLKQAVRQYFFMRNEDSIDT